MEEIDPRRLLVKITDVLGKLKIPYATTGGMAVFVWGRPRFTADIDIVLLLDTLQINPLVEALEAISEVSYIDKDAVKTALERHGEFNFIDGASGIKVDFWIIGGRVFDKEQLSRRITKDILGHQVYFVSPEDLILNKLLWYKESGSTRQLEDVESILKIQKKLDWKYLKKWAKEQATLKILNTLWKKNSKN